MKLCPTCCTEKPLTEFYHRDRARTKPQFQCKVCINAYKRAWYAKDSKQHKYASEVAKRRRIGRDLRAIRDYFESYPCIDCGESDPVVLEFDHVRGVKAGNLSRMVRERPWPVILAEIEKCDVRCANCYRRRTARHQGWYTTYL